MCFQKKKLPTLLVKTQSALKQLTGKSLILMNRYLMLGATGDSATEPALQPPKTHLENVKLL